MQAWTRLKHLFLEKRTLLGIAVLALVVAFTGWRRMAAPPADTGAMPPAVTRDTDYTMERFTLTLLDEQGRLGVSLAGEAMEHDPRDGRSRIQTPQATVTGDEGTLWDAGARQGWISDDGGELKLSGDVRLARQASETVSPLELNTEELFLYPRRDQAWTPAPVSLIQPGARLEGTGMQVDLARGSYQLNAQVRGRYDTPDSQ